ncbi:MAG TPA: hypothetical protein VFI31_14275 [Pirellulales bacterium]|nr:hypothetical protein [Pirellulales bacterium]
MNLRTIYLLLIALLAGIGSARAQYSRHDDEPPPLECCTCGQYWRITAFCAPICGCYDPSKLQYYFYDRCRDCWVHSSFEAFLAADDPQVATCFFLPGFEPARRNSPEEYVENATKGGWLIYNRVAPRNRPFRMVLFAWPADRDKGERMLPDMREKLRLAEQYGWYLAWLMDQMHPQVPIGFVSDSLGAATLTGAMHVLGGGTVSGVGLWRIHPDRRPPSAAMMASTMDNTWMSVNGRHGQALSAVDDILITVNQKDRMLKLYVAVHIGEGRALGENGIAGSLGPYADRVRYLNAAPYVGGRHWWTAYLRSPPVVAAFRPYAFPLPEPYEEEMEMEEVVPEAPTLPAPPRVADSSSPR